MLYLNRSQSHIFTRTGLSLLLTIIVFIACYPAALRVNQLSDTQGLQTYTYIKTGESSFHPIDAELPSIRLTPSKYWDSIKNNASVNFELRKGGLGFYQLNMRTVYEKISHWQCTQDVLAKKKNIGDCTTDD